VTDHDMPTSGSRWEPASGGPTTPADDAVRAEHAAAPAERVAPPSDEVGPSRPPRRPPGRSAVAAAGVGLVLAGGIGGFAIGQAVAGNAVSDGAVTDRNGVPGDRPDFRDGDRPSPGGVGPDDTSPDGTVPGAAPPDTGGDGGTA